MSESVNEELNRIKSNIVNTYNTLSDVGLISEGDTNSDNLSNTVKNLSWGGGELCDIGLALFIDESAGMRRLLNGQILNIEPKYKPFLNKLQLIATAYPNILCTETEWQNIKSVSVYGQVGKFVLNYDESGEIIGVRLPAIVNLQGLQDLQYLGNIVEAGIPQHSHTSTTDSVGAHEHARGTMEIKGSFTPGQGDSGGVAKFATGKASYSGAFYMGTATSGAVLNETGGSYNGASLEFQASKNWTGATSSNGAHTHTVTVSNANESHYGKASTVQQEAIQYPYYIQVNLTEYNHMIDVGLVNDLNDRTNVLEDRIYLVETYNEGDSWYRIYSDGWCEQGGYWTGNISIAQGSEQMVTINLHKHYKTNTYFATSSVIGTYCMPFKQARNLDTIGFSFGAYEVARTLNSFVWEAKGYIEL
jgi:hypothetical protein